MKHKIIIIQAAFLIIVLIMLYFAYPRTRISLEGNVVNFDSVNANTIILSENPDFSNPRYIEIGENLSLKLKTGTYYWKAENNLIKGLKKKFTINSEVGLMLEEEENETNLVNIGNVKVNVTKTKEGVMVGHIILEPEEKESISKENETYEGRQDER